MQVESLRAFELFLKSNLDSLSKAEIVKYTSHQINNENSVR